MRLNTFSPRLSYQPFEVYRPLSVSTADRCNLWERAYRARNELGLEWNNPALIAGTFMCFLMRMHACDVDGAT